MFKICMAMTKDMALGQAVAYYLTSLSSGEREAYQQELYHFVRWYGWERSLTSLKPPEIANYAERVGEDKKLEGIKAFLAYAKKEGLTPANLSVHLRLKKMAAKATPLANGNAALTTLTPEGYAGLKAELENLQQEHPKVVEEVRLARQDKDFRENAPLEAARERLRQLEGRIKELEALLKRAVVGNQQKEASRVGVGSWVRLKDLASGERVEYYLVSPQEVNLARGRVSRASPLGRALLGKGEGEVVVVATPGGHHQYEIEKVSFPGEEGPPLRS